MKKVLLTIALIIAIALISLYAVFSIYEREPVEKTEITFYMDNPMKVNDFADEIESHSYFKGYNNTTLNWIRTLDSNNVVFSSNDTYVIMGPSDLGRIPVESATDVTITDTVRCYVKEKRPLGNDLRDVIFVDDVEFVSKHIKYYDV